MHSWGWDNSETRIGGITLRERGFKGSVGGGLVFMYLRQGISRAATKEGCL